MEINEILLQQAIVFLFLLLIGAIFLHLATKILKFQQRSYGKAILTVFIGNIILFAFAFIPFRLIGELLGLLCFWFLIKVVYSVGWIKAFLAWLMSIVVAFIIVFVIIIILGVFGIIVTNVMCCLPF